MSALGIWNNRYEGGPCYAACMETFTLYFPFYAATIPPSPSAGRDVITEQVASTRRRAESRPSACASASRLKPWPWRRASWRLWLTWECTRRCFPPFLKISTGPVSPAFADRDIDLYREWSMKPNDSCIARFLDLKELCKIYSYTTKFQFYEERWGVFNWARILRWQTFQGWKYFFWFFQFSWISILLVNLTDSHNFNNYFSPSVSTGIYIELSLMWTLILLRLF